LSRERETGGGLIFAGARQQPRWQQGLVSKEKSVNLRINWKQVGPSALFLSMGLALIQPAQAQAQDLLRYNMKLTATRCGNTEDVTGADEYYVAAVFIAVMPDGKRKAYTLITEPFDINDNETNTNPQTFFDADLPRGSRVYGQLRFYDEDAAHDWKEIREQFSKAANDAMQAGMESENPKAMIAGAAANAIFQVVDGIASADKDDKLGFLDVTINDPVDAPGGTMLISVKNGKGEVGSSVAKDDFYVKSAKSFEARKDMPLVYWGRTHFSKTSSPLDFSTWDYTQDWTVNVIDPKVDPQTGAPK